jgi:hypothetical protein
MARQEKNCVGLEISNPLQHEGNNVYLSLLEVNPYSSPFKGIVYSSTSVSMNIEISINKDRD